MPLLQVDESEQVDGDMTIVLKVGRDGTIIPVAHNPLVRDVSRFLTSAIVSAGAKEVFLRSAGPKASADEVRPWIKSGLCESDYRYFLGLMNLCTWVLLLICSANMWGSKKA